MTAAVRALIPAAFDHLRLHRLEAACIPTNLASVRLLEKTGFRREGYARSTSALTGPGRTICCTPACKPTRGTRTALAGALGLPRSACYKSVDLPGFSHCGRNPLGMFGVGVFEYRSQRRGSLAAIVLLAPMLAGCSSISMPTFNSLFGSGFGSTANAGRGAG